MASRRQQARYREAKERAEARDDLVRGLRAAGTKAAAWAVAFSGPSSRVPGGQFTSNLAFFLRELRVPAGSNDEERAEYLALLQRLAATGEVTAEQLAEYEADLERHRSQGR